MSDEYKELHVEKHVLGKLITDGYKAQGPEYARAFEELEQFKKRGMINLLRYMIYLSRLMRENNIVWGVGRGSSVASYVLFLIGVHRINPNPMNLDWREFRDKYTYKGGAIMSMKQTGSKQYRLNAR